MRIGRSTSSRRGWYLMSSAVVAAAFLAVSLFIGPGGGRVSTAEAFDDSLEQYLASIEGKLPPEQEPALADGFVTFEEHEAAVQATIACATAAGVNMRPIPGHGLSPTRLGYVSADDEELRRSGEAVSACVSVHLSYIETVRAAQPVRDETIQEAAAMLAACMNERAAGALFDPATVRSVMAEIVSREERTAADWSLLPIWAECRSLAEGLTGFEP